MDAAGAGGGGEGNEVASRLRDLSSRIADLAASKARPFVPHHFDVPTQHAADGYTFRALLAADLDTYHAAASVSPRDLRAAFGIFGDAECGAPAAGVEDSLVELRRHEKEHELRLAFAFAVTSNAPDKEGCADSPRGSTLPNKEGPLVGCVFLFPATKIGFDAEVFLWVTERRSAPQEATELDASVERTLRQWVQSAWPFESVAYPGRVQCWTAMAKLPWRSEPVPRIALDAQTVIMHHARGHGLATPRPFTSVAR
uniref:Uncharacterized protein n=1 Tax=Haptolina ericina TaxID=156174 RepID=A0A7S3F652_9EUKA